VGCGCLVALVAWLSPRFAIFLMWVFTGRLSEAFDSFIVGALGFVFLPYTTVIYALCWSFPEGVSGFGWLLVLLGFFLDMSTWFGGGQQARNRQRSQA